MLSPDDHAKLIDLAERAAKQPVDMREALLSRAHALEFNRVMDTFVLHLGTLRVMFAHEYMPPTWTPMRHLSVSDAGKPPSDELFQWIADVMGLGPRETWHEMTWILEHALRNHLVARHALKLPD